MNGSTWYIAPLPSPPPPPPDPQRFECGRWSNGQTFNLNNGSTCTEQCPGGYSSVSCRRRSVLGGDRRELLSQRHQAERVESRISLSSGQCCGVIKYHTWWDDDR